MLKQLDIQPSCLKMSDVRLIITTIYIPYSGKVWRAECLANLLFLNVWRKKVWRMTRSAIGLSMVTINLDGFSLANGRRFAKFAKLSPRQTFPLYGSLYQVYHSLVSALQHRYAFEALHNICKDFCALYGTPLLQDILIHLFICQAHSQKFLLGGSFRRNVDLIHHPTVAKEHSAQLHGVCITHIRESSLCW